jgi:hypothetical protein
MLDNTSNLISPPRSFSLPKNVKELLPNDFPLLTTLSKIIPLKDGLPDAYRFELHL